MRARLVGLALVALLCGCSRQEEQPQVRQTAEPVKTATRGIFRIENAQVAKDRAMRPSLTSIDVAGLTAAELKAKLEAFTHPESTYLWMPGEQSWLVVERPSTNAIPLEMAMEAVASDSRCTLSLPEIFACYVGPLTDVLPAFASKLEGAVVPEWFVTKDVPEIGWLDARNVDRDIAELVRHEIRSMQVVRRMVLEGNMAARVAQDVKGEKAATDRWARAMLRNPHDPLLLERLELLESNARVFLEAGQPLQAMKCYETMILVNPKDAVAIHNFGICLRRIGKKDMAEDVLKRAEELTK